MPVIAITNCRKLEDYRQSMLHVGAEVRVLETSKDLAGALEGIDGLLLTGGGDVDPVLYGEAPHPTHDAAEAGRDQFELGLVSLARERQQPVELAHEIWIDKDSLLARLMRERLSDTDACEVNSRHHQAVRQIAPGFVSSATAPDGVIEAIEDPKAAFCLGVQWHPENFFRTGEFRPLFEGFLEATSKT